MQLSIITVVRNGVDTIRHCLESVAGQSVPAEHIVIDGQSTDGTLDVLSKIQAHNPRLSFISEADRGIYDAMNKGIRRAHGDVIGCLNADDFYASRETLERVAQAFADPDVQTCYGDLLYVRRMGVGEVGRSGVGESVVSESVKSVAGEVGRSGVGEVGSPLVPWSLGPLVPDAAGQSEFRLPGELVVRRWRAGSMGRKGFHWGWMPPHPAFFVRRAVYEKYGLFRLDLGTAADYELMLRFLVKHGVSTRYIPQVLVKMLAGGVSNASWRNRVRANRNDRRAWAVNGLRPYPWTLLLKPARKLGQWVGRWGR